jgi:enamine deaminase RidA (YjgF/YER057c/UK114 family)
VNNPINLSTQERFGRTCVSTGSKWEPLMGYSRAVRVGGQIAITGTVGVNADGTYSPDIGEQTRRSLDIILAALHALGSDVRHVIRTRIYTTRLEQWEAIANVHGNIFGEIRPATTLVGVAKLIDDAALIEIEADAVVPE